MRVLDHRLQRRPPGRAQPLEAGQLGLDRHARRPRRVDHHSAVAHDGSGGTVRSRCAGSGSYTGELARRGPQRRGVRIETEHDLRLAFGDARRKGVAEGAD